MKKQIIALAVTGALCLGGLASCGGSSTNTNNTANTNNTNTTQTANTNTNANATKNTTTTTTTSDITAIKSELEANLSTCYMGVGGDYKTGQAVDDFDITYYMGFSTDASWGIVVAVDVEPESNGKYDYISFVGSTTANSDGTYTIVDDTTGNSLTFSATQQSDGTWILDLGTVIGKAQVASCTSSDLVAALELIDQYGEPME